MRRPRFRSLRWIWCVTCWTRVTASYVRCCFWPAPTTCRCLSSRTAPRAWNFNWKVKMRLRSLMKMKSNSTTKSWTDANLSGMLPKSTMKYSFATRGVRVLSHSKSHRIKIGHCKVAPNWRTWYSTGNSSCILCFHPLQIMDRSKYSSITIFSKPNLSQ